MADFLFGKIGAAIEAGRDAAARVYSGPVSGSPSDFLSMDFGDFTLNADRFFTINGSPNEFIWGQKWGNTKTKVVK